MHIREIRRKERTDTLIDALVDIWELSVRATHHFLSEPEVLAIKPYVPDALRGVEHLMVAFNEQHQPLGFMGVEQQNLEMLFLAPSARGQGYGAQLLTKGINELHVTHLEVNEQNPTARAFYEHMGFRVYRRTPLDKQGNPYPLLYMTRD